MVYKLGRNITYALILLFAFSCSKDEAIVNDNGWQVIYKKNILLLTNFNINTNQDIFVLNSQYHLA